ncbi:MAG: NAD-dependent epimerase/dehydratase family protein [Dehalococcoidia bacterium]|nr:NAD-dependent epimerase/dehydratase family protein [Dehalococcoidia bacterium]
MRVLVTGGTGYIGTELVRTLVGQGDEVVTFGPTTNMSRIADIAKDITIIRGNLAYGSEVFNAVKDHRIERIFHMGSMLSTTSQVNPWASFQTNVVGTMNMLEAARLFEVPRFIFTSTIGTYAHGAGKVVTDETLQRPATMYGAGKLYCEGLGRFYRTKFGLDFRSIRYPSVIGPGTTQRTVAQYNSWMIEYPAQGKPFECFVTPGTKGPGMYFRDAIRALTMVADAPFDSIQMVNYNVGGLVPTPSAKEIEHEVLKHIPDAAISYNPDPVIMDYYATAKVETFDDSVARKEWGWKPEYETIADIVPDFINEVRTNPSRFGLAQA